MNQRYYCTDLSGDRVTLEGSEAHHLLHVMRAQAGHAVDVFDGMGLQRTATICGLGRSTVELELGPAHQDAEQPARAIEVGVSLPKGDRQKWLVEKCTELGVERLTPLSTERTVSLPKGTATKLDRYVIEACKQCGRNTLMQIGSPTPWGEWLQRHDETGLRWIAHPGGEPCDLRQLAAADRVALGVGPEGGFTDGEVGLAESLGWRRVGLGKHVLRIETAAVVGASLALMTPHQ